MSDRFQLPGQVPGELLDLFWDLHEETLTPERAERLSELLLADERHRLAYMAFMDMVAGLEWSQSGDGPQIDLNEPAPSVRPAPVGHDASASPLCDGGSLAPNDPQSGGLFGAVFSTGWLSGPLTLALACLLIAGLAIWNFLPQADERAAKDGTIVVASLHSSRDCVWSDASGPIAEGDPLYAGRRLELVQGVAKLQFQGGAAVVVESPTTFEIATATSMRLYSGTVAVRANGEAKDFVVVSPDASIVDLGTSFGVHYDPARGTEVEVFEGAVEVFPDESQDANRVIGIGESVRVAQHGQRAAVDVMASEVDRFANLVELLWEDISHQSQNGDEPAGNSIVAEFDSQAPGSIDTFYGASRGRGWLTPWVAAGNPSGHITYEDPLSGEGNPYLRLRFYRSYERALARQYGARNDFDPTKPHVISWRWRFDGNSKHFGGSFEDRIYFYSNPYFRRNSWRTNGWLIGVAGGNEDSGKLRTVYANRWYAFDGKPGEGGKDFDRRNMVDTGMEFKPNVIYRFAVAVYPEIGKYDVAIRDDSTTFTKTGLAFRDPDARPSNVLHFGVSADNQADDLSFSVDSIRIESLDAGEWQDRLDGEK